MFLALLLACSNAPSAPPPPPQDDGSSVASALSALQSGQTPDPKPVDREPPPVPEGVAERAPVEPAASGGLADSPECAAARRARDEHEAAIERYRSNDVAAAEQRYINAEAALSWCLGDIGGCASDGQKIQDYQVAVGVAEKAMSDANFHVGELEAEFYKLDKAITAACGTSRY